MINYITILNVFFMGIVNIVLILLIILLFDEVTKRR